MARREQLFDAATDPILHRAEMSYRAFIEAPPGNDPTTRSLGYAGMRLLQKPGYQDFLNTHYSGRPHIPISHMGGINRGIFQEAVLHPDLRRGRGHILGQYDPYKFTESKNPFLQYRDPHIIEEFMERYLGTPEGARVAGQHSEDHNVPTTTILRYGIPIIISTMLQTELPDRISKQLRVADIGCSLGHGLKWWLMKDFFMGKSQIDNPMGFSMKKITYDEQGEVKDYTADRAATERMHRIGKKASALALGVGGDIMPINDRDVVRFGESMFYPQEYIIDPTNTKLSKFEEFHLLTEMRPDTFRFFQADYTRLDFDEFYHKVGLQNPREQNFDIVMALTMMYELTPDQQARMLDTLLELAGSNGIVILQDAARIDENNPTKLITDSDSFGIPWQIRTIVIDPRNPIMHEWMIAKSGRLTEVALGKDFGVLGGKPVPGLRELFGLPIKSAA